MRGAQQHRPVAYSRLRFAGAGSLKRQSRLGTLKMGSRHEAALTSGKQEAVVERSGILEVGVVRGKSTVLRSFCRYPLRFLQPSKVSVALPSRRME